MIASERSLTYAQGTRPTHRRLHGRRPGLALDVLDPDHPERSNLPRRRRLHARDAPQDPARAQGSTPPRQHRQPGAAVQADVQAPDGRPRAPDDAGAAL